MKVLILSDGEDNGGVGAAIKFAFDRYAPGWEVRAVRRKNNFIDFPADIETKSWEPILPLFRAADVIHVMDKFSAVEWAPMWQDKPLVMHHHGLVFNSRSGPGMAKRCSDVNMVQISALPGLTQYADGIRWVPNPCDVGRMQALRKSNWSFSRKPRIGQTPAQRAPNSTDVFLGAWEHVKDRALLMLIENVTWKTCLMLKAQADIVFDSFISGYGLAGMESMAMSVPLISGGDAWTENRIAREIGYLPYLSATPDTLAMRMATLVDSPSSRREYGEMGLAFASAVHDEPVVVKLLQTVYEEALQGEHRG